MIFYENNGFYVEDLGLGPGAFLRLYNWTIIYDNMLVNIGQSYIVFNILPSDDAFKRVKLKIYGGPLTG